jgi:hypothetical protein
VRELRAAKRSPSVNADAYGGLRIQRRYAPDDMNLWPSGLPGSDEEVIVRDLDRWLLSLLDSVLREINEYRFSGKTIDQIAKRQGRSRRTIERMFQEIRSIWSSVLRDS